MKKYPFKFLQSYSLADNDIFFGRDEEVDALYKMVFQHSILLVYGASGTGKTSLIQCGLAGRFKSYDWLALTVRRSGNINASLEQILTEARGNSERDEEEMAAENKKILTGIPKLISEVYINHFKPVYLIFDQFEELYILGNKEEEKQFIGSIEQILASELPVKLIFSIREEYLGHLYEFEKSVPQLLRKKLRVAPMTIDNVTDILKGINDCKNVNVRIQPEEIPAIVGLMLERLRGNSQAFTIQLPHLQIFLDNLYVKITGDKSHQAEALITSNSISDMKDLPDVLGNFLEDQVESILSEKTAAGTSVTAATVWKILSPFATLEGTKEPIPKDRLAERLPGIDKQLVTDCVAAFFSRRILHYVENTDREELMHDALAKYIAAKRTPEEIEVLEIRRMIRQQTDINRESNYFFTNKQLARIKPCLDELYLGPEEDKLLKESFAAQKIKQRRTYITAAAVIAGLAIIVLSGNWLYRKNEAAKIHAINLRRFETLCTKKYLQENYLQAFWYMIETLCLQDDKKKYNALVAQATESPRTPAYTLENIFLHDTDVVRAGFAAGDTCIYTWTRTGLLSEWNLRTGQLVRSANTRLAVAEADDIAKKLISIDTIKVFSSAASNALKEKFLPDSANFFKKLYIDSVVVDKDITGLPTFPAITLSIKGASFSKDRQDVLTWGRNTESIYTAVDEWDGEGNTLGPSLIHDGVNGAVFNNDKSMILSWGDRTARIWKLSADTGIYQLPAELMKMKAKLQTGVEMSAADLSIKSIAPAAYFELQENYKWLYKKYKEEGRLSK